MGNAVSSKIAKQGLPMPGRTLGDLFYPSNPKLRQRCTDLEYDCNAFIKEFNIVKKDFDRLEKTVHEKMMAFLNSKGFDNLDDLQAKVEAVAEGEALENYKKMKEMINRTTVWEEALFAIVSWGSIVAPIAIGGLVAVAVLSGPVGWAALGAVAGVSLLLSLGGVAVAAIAGKIQQKKMKNAIKELFEDRLELQIQVNRLNVMKEWMYLFENFFESDWGTDDEATLQMLLGVTFKRKSESTMPLWKAEKAIDDLKFHDKNRESWTGADPPYVIPNKYKS
ncbi:hypothetical protein BJ875DRAFT_472626 [Amylocarpus encephaloides]|uniref:Uncharacterized protein n=1 Tax=Amylocarpus encephaloides TaxID=45428 RepID=A0A9P8C1G1_9HELO|nr:hypothetical protein BJ875DRAFT_472626 [Amylocarpus encephaloides]